MTEWTMRRRGRAYIAQFVIVALCLFQGVQTVLAWDSYVFDLPSNSKESLWRDALAERLHGQIEVGVEGGRIDVLTDTLAIEVDFQHKWHEGLGQALHYADASGKQGTVALISYSQSRESMREKSRRRLDMVDALCQKSGIKLMVLFPMHPREKDSDGKKVSRPERLGEQKYRYWLNTKSGIRHNSGCRFYNTTGKGYQCGPKEGRPCSICGG